MTTDVQDGRNRRRPTLQGTLGQLARLSLALITTITLACTAALAAGYPNNVVTLVVPYPAGTATDTYARIFARKLEADLGQRFIVENRPGANGMNGSATIVRAKPDGYTLLFTTNSTHTTVTGLYKAVPYDPVKDFTPVAILSSSSTLLVVRSDLKIDTMAQLVAHAKANPGKLNVGYANASGQIAAEVLKKRAALDITTVPYRGTPQAMTDLLGGNLQLAIADIVTAGQYFDAGTLKPLAFFSKTRRAVLPKVETYHETIAPGLDLSFWYAVFAPPGTPKDVVDVLAKAFRKALDDDELKAFAVKIGLENTWTGPEQFAPYLASEITRWDALIKDAGIQKE